MGYTTVYKTVPNTKEFFVKELSFENADGTYAKVVDCRTKGNQVYMAVEHGNIHTEARVSGVVALIKRSKGTFTYKTMHEDAGPYYWNCPDVILNQLSETTNEFALKWRKGCLVNRERRALCKSITTSDTVTFDKKLNFGKCGADTVFRCVDPKRGIYYAVNLALMVKLTINDLLAYNFDLRKAA